MQQKRYDKQNEVAHNQPDIYQIGEFNLMADEESGVYDFIQALTKMPYSKGWKASLPPITRSPASPSRARRGLNTTQIEAKKWLF